jgi:putative drug exporter of the RND superfamily
MSRDLGDIQVRTASTRHDVIVVGQWTHPYDFEALHTSVLALGKTHPQVTIEETADISASEARDRVVSNDLRRAELLSVPVTLFVLLFAFGAIVAALVPVLLALTAVAAAFGLLGPISQLFPLDDAKKTVVLLVGMAVGVDYALFYVIRSRQERRRGLPSHEALELTARTSRRTVVVSGTTVAVAMAGMYFVGSKIFNGIASGTIAVILCAVAGSVTVAACGAGAARAANRPWSHSRPAPPAHRFEQVALPACRDRPRPAVPRTLGGALGRVAGRARSARARPALLEAERQPAVVAE